MNTVRLLGINIATRAQRRCLVVLLYSSLLAMGAVYPANRMFAVIPALLCMVTYWGVFKVTQRYAVDSSDRKEIVADEREAGVRDRALARSYAVVSSILVLIMGFAASFGDDPTAWHATHKQLNFLFVVVLLLTSTLPQAMIAWSEPDAPFEE